MVPRAGDGAAGAGMISCEEIEEPSPTPKKPKQTKLSAGMLRQLGGRLPKSAAAGAAASPAAARGRGGGGRGARPARGARGGSGAQVESQAKAQPGSKRKRA
eukprot:39978-Prymnesium_polylepis.1